MIRLEGRTPIGQGSKRACYEHPDNPDRIIKVLLPGAAPEILRRKNRSLRRRLLPASYMDEQRRELRAFRRLEARLGAEAWRHVSAFYGTVQTDKGLGLVTRFLRNADGTSAVDLAHYLKNDYNSAIRESVSTLLQWIVQYHLVPRDLNTYNVMVAHDETQRPHAWLVDGFGTAGILPVTEWSRRHGQWMARRRVARFEERVEQKLLKMSEEKSNSSG